MSVFTFIIIAILIIVSTNIQITALYAETMIMLNGFLNENEWSTRIIPVSHSVNCKRASGLGEWTEVLILFDDDIQYEEIIFFPMRLSRNSLYSRRPIAQAHSHEG